MPRQIGEQGELLTSLGLQIPASGLAAPTDPPLGAVVSLGGCTASFVSPLGLVVTNHHCVQGALQLNSTPESNLVENGFLAATKEQELSAGPAQRILVTQKITDITEQVRQGLDALADGSARYAAVEARSKQLTAECEKDRPGIRCQVYSFFKGGEYQLIESLEIRDVRLVYVPARSIGNYGGEVDNWAWPRHTGDFSFYRAYVGPDGKPADFSTSNVPFAPPHWLRVATHGVTDHDLVMVAGYPGRTNRQQTASELRHAYEFTYERFIDKARQRMSLLEELQKLPGETAIKAGVSRQGVQNGLEKYEGIRSGLTDGLLIAQKEAEETAFRAWVAQDPARASYGTALDALEAKLLDIRAAERNEETWRDVASGSSLLRSAILIARWSEEQQKPDAERKPGYQTRDESRVLGAQRTLTRQYDAAIDRAFMRMYLVRAAAAPAATRPWLGKLLGLRGNAAVDETQIDRALDGWYGATTLAAEATRLELLKAKPATLKKSRDPFIKLALMLVPRIKELEARDEAWSGDLAILYPSYLKGLQEFKGGRIAPDANSSLRISYGTVRGYRPAADRPIYEPFTTAAQILEKNTGTTPFDAPERLLAAIRAGNWGPYAHNGALPVDFLSDLDITGGNSGSPVMNARGELVGLAFDGNYEGLASDVVFKGETTRTISCDIRYVLWVADFVDHANNILTEMGVTPSSEGVRTDGSGVAVP